MTMDFDRSLRSASTLTDVWEVVKVAAQQTMGRSRAGLMLALADLGNSPGGWFGAFYPVATNVIVMNRIPLKRIKETEPELWPFYAFHVLLHEYLHALGTLNEAQCRAETRQITEELFPPDHVAVRMARGMQNFFPNLVYPDVAWQPRDLKMELVRDFDRGATSYIG